MASPTDNPANGSSPDEPPLPQHPESEGDDTPTVPRNPFIVPLFPSKRESRLKKEKSEDPLPQPGYTANRQRTQSNDDETERSAAPEIASSSSHAHSFPEEKITDAPLVPAYVVPESFEEEREDVAEEVLTVEAVENLLSVSASLYNASPEYSFLPKFEAFKRPSPPSPIGPPSAIGRYSQRFESTPDKSNETSKVAPAGYSQRFESTPDIPKPPENSPIIPKRTKEAPPTKPIKSRPPHPPDTDTPADEHADAPPQDPENSRSSIIDIKIGEDPNYHKTESSAPRRSLRLFSHKKLSPKNDKKKADLPPTAGTTAIKPSAPSPSKPKETSSRLIKFFGYGKKNRRKSEKRSITYGIDPLALPSQTNSAVDHEVRPPAAEPKPPENETAAVPETASEADDAPMRRSMRNKEQKTIPLHKEDSGLLHDEAPPDEGEIFSYEKEDQLPPEVEERPVPAELPQEIPPLPEPPALPTIAKQPKKTKKPSRKEVKPRQKKKQSHPVKKLSSQPPRQITPLPPITPPPKIIPIPQPKRYASQAFAKVVTVTLKSLMVVLVAALLSITTLTVLYLNAITTANSPNERNRIEIYNTNLTLIETAKRLNPTLGNQNQSLLASIVSDLERQNRLLEKTNTVVQAKPLDVYTVPEFAKELNSNARRAYESALNAPSDLSALFSSIAISQYFTAQNLVEADLADADVLSWTFHNDMITLDPSPHSCSTLTNLSRASSKNHLLFNTSLLEQNLIYLLEVEKARRANTTLATPENILFHKKQQQNLNYYLSADCVESPRQEAAFSLPVDFGANPQRTILEQVSNLLESYAYLVAATPAVTTPFQSVQVRSFAVNSMFSTAEISRALGLSLGATPGLDLNM